MENKQVWERRGRKSDNLRLIVDDYKTIQCKTGYGLVGWLRIAVVVIWGGIEVVMHFNEVRQSKQESGSQGDALNIGRHNVAL
jgi:hypothetical protein